MKRVLSLAVAALMLVGITSCSSSSGLVTGSSITVAELHSASSLNTDVASSAASEAVNAEIAHLTTASFYSVDQTGELIANPGFGSVSIIKSSPFTVKYLLTGGAKWSDSEQITATDLLLSWAAATNLGKAKFNSSRLGSGLSLANGVPTIGDKNLSLTIEFARPVADYKTVLTVAVAAHALAKVAFAGQNLDSKSGNDRVLNAIQTTNVADLKTLAKSYRLAYQLKSSFSLSTDLGITSGAYQIETASNLGLTLKANTSNVAMPSARVETIKLVFYSSPLAVVADLKAGQVDLASLAPTATDSSAAINTVLKATTSAGVTSTLTGTSSIETLVLNQAGGSSFANSSYGRSSSKTAGLKAFSVRQAFLSLVSTSKIQSLVGANQPVQDAKSFVFTPDSSYYQSSIQDSGVLAYQFADDQKAYNIVRKVGHRVEVRVLFDTNNPLAQIEYSTLAEKANEVGFALSNISTNDPNAVLQSGEYDVYLAPAIALGDSGTDLEQALASATGSQGAADAVIIDALTGFATATDAVSRAALTKKIDGELISTAYGLPLYQLPTIVASSKKFAKAPNLVDGSSLTAGYATWNLAG